MDVFVWFPNCVVVSILLSVLFCLCASLSVYECENKLNWSNEWRMAYVQTRRNREKRCPHGKEYGNMNINMKKQGKVWDVTEQPPRKRIDKNDAVPGCPPPPPPRFPARPPKPVDEDLYKIPPELLHSTKRVSLSL